MNRTLEKKVGKKTLKIICYTSIFQLIQAATTFMNVVFVHLPYCPVKTDLNDLQALFCKYKEVLGKIRSTFLGLKN